MTFPALLCLVVAITDGDTLTVRCPTDSAEHPYQQVKVRLSAIDAPERKQPFGSRAKQALSDLTFQKQARLECGKTDRYKRSVCNVWVAPASAPDGPQTLDAGLAMVTQGMAWWYRAYSKEQTPEARGQYEFAEQEAQARKVGLWSEPGAVAPWEFRRRSGRPISYGELVQRGVWSCCQEQQCGESDEERLAKLLLLHHDDVAKSFIKMRCQIFQLMQSPPKSGLD